MWSGRARENEDGGRKHDESLDEKNNHRDTGNGAQCQGEYHRRHRCHFGLLADRAMRMPILNRGT